LMDVFRREMGLKSETDTGLSVFGKRVTWDPFKLWRQTCPAWKSAQSL
jgi:hypothetical protein